MKYNPTIFNKGVFPANISVVVYASPDFTDYLYEVEGFAGIADGMVETVNGWNWYRVGAIDGVNLWGWVREDQVVLKTVNPIEYNDSQAQVNLIIQNDANAISYLLIAAQACKLAERRGVNTNSLKSEIRKIYASVHARNELLLQSPNLKDVSTGKSNLTEFAPALESILRDEPFVGVPWVPIVVIAAFLAGAGVATAVYYNMVNASKNSMRDFQASKQVKENIYSKLSSSDIELLESEINLQIKGNYQSGYWSGVSDLSKWLKYGVVAIGALLLVNIIRDR